ncbi:MAG: GntR family transcriptional regulator, partial [Candidatus Nanopelagicaceae bacterium]
MPRVAKKHKHVELRERLQNRFSKLKPHSQIPSARQLATTYGVSTMTIRQALAAL